MMSLATLLALGLCASATPLQRRQSPVPASVPSFVTEYAPMVYLFSQETYLPSDIGAQLTNTQPALNYTVLSDPPKPLTLSNLNALNNVPDSDGGLNIYLNTLQPPQTFPAFLGGVLPNAQGKTEGAVSCAIVVNHHPGTDITDVFYFYFYAFNYGGTYYGLTVDDHIGDWEHNMQRFVNGTPSQMFFSQHSSGEAFTYSALEKFNNTARPVTYSANGTHANYASSGAHDHTIPGIDLPIGPIEDHTDKGPIWDPTLAAYYYTYDAASNTFAAYDESTSPVEWLSYVGRWGNEQLKMSDPAQSCPFGISALCKWTSGPTGPEDKDLNRTNVCPNSDKICFVQSIVLPGE